MDFARKLPVGVEPTRDCLQGSCTTVVLRKLNGPAIAACGYGFGFGVNQSTVWRYHNNYEFAGPSNPMTGVAPVYSPSWILGFFIIVIGCIKGLYCYLDDLLAVLGKLTYFQKKRGIYVVFRNNGERVSQVLKFFALLLILVVLF